MKIDEYLLNDNYLKKQKLIKEMEEYTKDKSKKFKNSDEYKNKYNHYLVALSLLDNDDEYLEDEIDVCKHKYSPYLRLKYFISEYISYYYKIVKKEYFKITKEIDVELDVDNLEKTMKEIEENINNLENEEKINYILNVNKKITSMLK